MPQLFNSPLAIVDVETTGMSYKNGSVIDVGILRVEHGQVVQSMRQLINPGTTLPAFITQLTGISNDDVADAPAFSEIAQDVYDLLEGCVFVAHNARFDYAFIKEELLRAGYQFRPRILCTVKLSRALYPQYRSHKLDALIERFAIPMLERHRAYADAEATWKALRCMIEQHDEAVVNAHIKSQLRQPSLPVQLPQQVISTLPESAGVYIFRSVTGAPLYVGKSINIRDRVLSHFSDDHRSPKEQRIAQDLTDIETIPTTGELGALLTESRLVKELMPIHNRMLRRQSEMVVAVKSEDENGYPTIRIERHKEIALGNQNAGYAIRNTTDDDQLAEKISISDLRSPISQSDRESESLRSPLSPDSRLRGNDSIGLSLDKVMGVYRSEKQAKEALLSLAKESHLCHKLLGLQKTNGACFPHQLKICHGACVGKESSLAYLMRFNQAFASTRIKQWPYPSPIVITETDYRGNSDGYIINNWCLIGQFVQRDQSVEYKPTAPSFDLDQYKILKRFTDNPKNQNLITLLSNRKLIQLINQNASEAVTSEAL